MSNANYQGTLNPSANGSGGGVTDLANKLQGALSILGQLNIVLQGGISFPRIVGGVLGYTLSTASANIVKVAADQQVTFHNLSSTATIYVSPALDANGNGLTAGANGTGSFTILPSADRTFMVKAGQWLGAATTTGVLLTVGLSQGT